MTSPINEADNILLGNIGQDRVYLGDALVWPPTPPVTPPAYRPIDWLPVDIAAGQQTILCLVHTAPTNTAHTVTVRVAGNYQVDWGDGSAVQQFPSTTTASHTYDGSTLPPATLTSDGYHQAIATITPQSGASLTMFSIDPQTTHADPVEIVVGHSGLSMFSLAKTSDSEGALSPKHVWFLSPVSLPNSSNMFRYNTFLRRVTGEIVVHDMTSTFEHCRSLLSDSDLVLGTASCTNFLYTFNDCTSLLTGFDMDTARGQDFRMLFAGCAALTSIPLYDVSSGTDFTQMFDGCGALVDVPDLDTSSGTSFGTMFNACRSLVNAPALSTGNGTNFTAMFQGCTSLVDAPVLDTSKGANFSYMFQLCTSLVNVPTYNTSSATTFLQMFMGCDALTTVPAIDLGARVTGSSAYNFMFYECSNLTSILATGAKYSISIGYIPMGRDAINTFFEGLATVTGQTVTIAACPGAPLCDRSIAQAKGWTVSG